MAKQLRSRVPESRRTTPSASRTLAYCGGTGRLVENHYAGDRRTYGLYEQSGHAGAALLLCESPTATYVALTCQWRPGDSDAIELPAGNIGQGSPERLIEGMLQEIREEVGVVEILEIQAAPGFVHDIGREVVPEGGGKCFFPFFLRVRSDRAPHREGRRLKTTWHTTDEVRALVRDHRITDMVTCFFLLAAGVIDTADLGWFSLPVP